MTRPGFTQNMSWFHSWFGLVAGWLLFMIFLTGTLAVYGPEITRWMRPERGIAHVLPEQALANAERYLREHVRDAHEWEIELPSGRDPLLTVAWHGENDVEIERKLGPATGRELPFHATEGGQFFNRMHYELRSGIPGGLVVMLIGVMLCALLVSGIVIHKRIFRDFFTFRPGKGQRSWLDAHNAAGVLTLPFLLMIAYTGVVLSFPSYLPAVAITRYGGDLYAPRLEAVNEPADRESGTAAALISLVQLHDRAQRTIGPIGRITVHHPGDTGARIRFYRVMTDRIASVADHISFDGVTGRQTGVQIRWNRSAYAYRGFVGIHRAQFGGEAVRLLYFLSGLAGCALIATGLILFVEKRRTRSPDASRTFLDLAARLNVAAVAGVMIACCAYLWASRVGPSGLADRVGWEIGAFFTAWVAALAHAMLRPSTNAWAEQLGFAALLCILLPVLNAAGSGDRTMAPDAVEASAIGVGLVLALAAWKSRAAGAGGR